MTRSSRLLIVLALVLAGLAGAVQLVTRQVVRPWTVAGPSMRPTLEPGDRLLVDLWTYRQRAPDPGEIVLFRGPEPEGALLVKRCMPVPAPEALRPRTGYWPPTRTHRGAGVWLRGDNVHESWDSRRFGAVPRDRIVGRVLFRYWPIQRAGRVR